MDSTEPTVQAEASSVRNEGRPGARLLRRLGVAAVGAGAFVLVASVVDPQLSPAKTPEAMNMPPVLSSEDREHVERMLAARAHAKGWRLLGVLEGIDYYTLAYASPDGPRYTVCALDGRLLLADLPAGEVYRAFPTLDLENLRLDPADLPLAPEGGPLMLADPQVEPVD
jgi:hypothetical protein